MPLCEYSALSLGILDRASQAHELQNDAQTVLQCKGSTADINDRASTADSYSIQQDGFLTAIQVDRASAPSGSNCQPSAVDSKDMT